MQRERLLDPTARMSEVLFGLIMALTFTTTLELTAGRDDVRTLLVGVIGCNIAWGLVDAVMFLIASLTQRGNGRLTIRAVRLAPEPEDAHRVITRAMAPILATILLSDDIERVRQRLISMPEVDPPTLRRGDWLRALAIFLPERQHEFVFDRGEHAQLDGQDVIRFEYRIRDPGKDTVSWDRDCVNMDFPSRLRGKAWVDAASGEVLRIDEAANGPVEMRRPREQTRLGVRDILTFDRYLESVRYQRVTFTDPDETLLLPVLIESIAMAGPGGTRRTQTYTNYRRFVTEGRVVE